MLYAKCLHDCTKCHINKNQNKNGLSNTTQSAAECSMGNCFSLHMPAHYESIFNYMIIYKTSASVAGALQHQKRQNPREGAHGATRASTAFLPQTPHQYKPDLNSCYFQVSNGSGGVVSRPGNAKAACKHRHLYITTAQVPLNFGSGLSQAFLVGFLLSSFPLFSLPQEEQEG